MRIFHIQSTSITETQDLAALTAAGMPDQGFLWVACARREFEVSQAQVQTMLQTLCGQQPGQEQQKGLPDGPRQQRRGPA